MPCPQIMGSIKIHTSSREVSDVDQYHLSPSTIYRLQVQALHRATVLLRLHDALTGRTEVVHLYPHATLPQSHETSLSTNCPNIRTGEIVLLVDKLVEVDIVAEGHLRCVEGENLLLGVFYRRNRSVLLIFNERE